MNKDIKAEIQLCENDIKWLKQRILILKKLAKSKNPTAMKRADQIIKELQ